MIIFNKFSSLTRARKDMKEAFSLNSTSVLFFSLNFSHILESSLIVFHSHFSLIKYLRASEKVKFFHCNRFYFIHRFLKITFFFSDDKNCTLDGELDKLYCRSQMYLARQMSRLRPEMTMPMFSGMLYD